VLTVPSKKLENSFFSIRVYNCDSCRTIFKVLN
jgi:hypothetical protein